MYACALLTGPLPGGIWRLVGKKAILICTVVLSQLCHGQLVMGGRWQLAAASALPGGIVLRLLPNYAIEPEVGRSALLHVLLGVANRPSLSGLHVDAR